MMQNKADKLLPQIVLRLGYMDFKLFGMQGPTAEVSRYLIVGKSFLSLEEFRCIQSIIWEQLIGKIAIKKKYVTTNQVQFCLKEKLTKAKAGQYFEGLLLLEKNFLDFSSYRHILDFLDSQKDWKSYTRKYLQRLREGQTAWQTLSQARSPALTEAVPETGSDMVAPETSSGLVASDGEGDTVSPDDETILSPQPDVLFQEVSPDQDTMSMAIVKDYIFEGKTLPEIPPQTKMMEKTLPPGQQQISAPTEKPTGEEEKDDALLFFLQRHAQQETATEAISLEPGSKSSAEVQPNAQTMAYDEELALLKKIIAQKRARESIMSEADTILDAPPFRLPTSMGKIEKPPPPDFLLWAMGILLVFLGFFCLYLAWSRPPQLVEQALQSQDQSLRLKAIELLGEIGTTQQLPLLQKVQNDADPQVSQAAQQALQKIQQKADGAHQGPP